MVHKKYELFQKMRKKKIDDKTIAHILGVSLRTIRRWYEAPPQKTGRKPSEARKQRALTAKRIARRTLFRNGRKIPEFPTCRRVAIGLREFGHTVCPETVRRDLKSVGVSSRVRSRHPNLGNAPKRLKFVKTWLAEPEKAEMITFSDEHTISTNDGTCRFQLVKEGQRPLPREGQRVQNIAHRMVWGAIGINFKSPLVILPRFEPEAKAKKGKKEPKTKKAYRLNARRYIDLCLAPNRSALRGKVCFRKRTYMQDGAGCHRAKITKTWLADNGIAVVQKWPAASPDLNPIECLWKDLNERISNRMPSNDEELVAAAYDAWASFTQEEINRYVRHFLTACKTVEKNRGF